MPRQSIKDRASLCREKLLARHGELERRVAQARDLAGAKNIVGAPSFAHFAKGGNLEHMRDRVAQPQKLCRQHRTRPCKKRKDGAPSARWRTPTSSKDGPTRQAFGISRVTVVISVLHQLLRQNTQLRFKTPDDFGRCVSRQHSTRIVKPTLLLALLSFVSVALAQNAPARTDLYHVHFAKAALGKGAELGEYLKTADPNVPMSAHHIAGEDSRMNCLAKVERSDSKRRRCAAPGAWAASATEDC